MNLKLHRNLTLSKKTGSQQGFSLIETVIALTTLGVCLAYAMPLFLYAKINNSKSEIRTGALIVAQRVFDNIRSKPVTDRTSTTGVAIAGLPINDGLNSPSTGINPVSKPINVNSPTPAEELLTKAMGRQYQTKVTYCGNYSTTDTDACGTKYRKFKVEVSYNGTKVYDLEGTYTELEDREPS
jgi:prepilin-type N-terminal cleavage/methylation domain-containing protein